MTAKFRLYFKTEALRKRFEPLLREIPDYFEFEIITGTPEIQILSDTDPMWIGFPYPVNSGDVYVFDDDIPAHAAGGGSEMRAAVRVMDHDPVRRDLAPALAWSSCMRWASQLMT